jgi:hypothetical protein
VVLTAATNHVNEQRSMNNDPRSMINELAPGIDKKNSSTYQRPVVTINLRSSLRSPDKAPMWKPDESLDDYIVQPAQEVSSVPPRKVWLRLTGEVEIRKPLTRREIPAATVYTSRSPVPFQPLWFRRLVAVGSGAIAMIAVVLVSAILIGINDPASGPDVATQRQPDDKLIQTEEAFSLDSFSPSSLAAVTGDIDIVRSNVRRKRARPSIHLAAYKPRRHSRQLRQPEEPKFFPTTLIIYAQNGVIYSRIEPWLQAGYKKPLTFNN